MGQGDTKSKFKAKLHEPASGDGWAFVILPKRASSKLPRRGRTTVIGRFNGCEFQVTLEPDGQLSHWLRVDKKLLLESAANPGDTVSVEITAVDQEPEPEVPSDLQEALALAPEALEMWEDTTTVARLDWIHWVVSAKQAKTRAKRVANACDMLASGKRRVCCFDPSGFYSKALSAPKAKG